MQGSISDMRTMTKIERPVVCLRIHFEKKIQKDLFKHTN